MTIPYLRWDQRSPVARIVIVVLVFVIVWAVVFGVNLVAN